MRSSSFLALLLAVLVAGCRLSSNESAREASEAGPKKAAAKSGSSEEKGGIASVLKAFKPEPVVLAEGTALPLVLETSVSSATSKEGDVVLGKLASEVRAGEKVVLPEGTEVRGRITAAVSSGRVKGRARLALDFDTIVYKGKEHTIATKAVDITAPKTHKKDAAIIGGGTAGGAIIGAIAGGKKGAGVGALVGAGAGTGTVLATKGKEITLPAGTQWTLKLTQEARLE